MPCSAWPEGGGMSGACECWWAIQLKPPLAGDEYIQFSLFFLPPSLQVPVIASHVSYWLLLLFLIISQLILFFLGADVLSHGQLFATPWTVCSPPVSSAHRIFQVRILKWVVISFSMIKLGIKLMSGDKTISQTPQEQFYFSPWLYFGILLAYFF